MRATPRSAATWRGGFMIHPGRRGCSWSSATPSGRGGRPARIWSNRARMAACWAAAASRSKRRTALPWATSSRKTRGARATPRKPCARPSTWRRNLGSRASMRCATLITRSPRGCSTRADSSGKACSSGIWSFQTRAPVGRLMCFATRESLGSDLGVRPQRLTPDPPGFRSALFSDYRFRCQV